MTGNRFDDVAILHYLPMRRRFIPNDFRVEPLSGDSPAQEGGSVRWIVDLRVIRFAVIAFPFTPEKDPEICGEESERD